MSDQRLDAPDGELAFFRAHLPPAPARILELGCGEGELTVMLAGASYNVLGIDPDAPDSPILRRERIEEHNGGPYDAVIAARSLHHVHDIDGVLARISRMTPRLLVADFAWERFDDATAAWYTRLRERLLLDGLEPHGPPAQEWRRQHEHLHTMEAMRSALDRHFFARDFGFTPYLRYYMRVEEHDEAEAAAIESGEIAPIGFRYVGESKIRG